MPDTFRHRSYGCEANSDIQDERVQRTQGLVREAEEGAEACPALWLRGLLPAEWVFEHPEADGQGWQRRWGVLAFEAPFDASGAGLVYAGSDGSGGEHGRDPRLRRVGWGLVLLASNLKPIGACCGTLEAGPHTVPRAELRAFVELAAATKGGQIHAFSDCKHVQEGAQVVLEKGTLPPGRRGGYLPNPDLWVRLLSAAEGRAGSLQVLKVKSHLTPSQFASTGLPPAAFLCNELADSLAGRAAEDNALPLGVSLEFVI